MSRSIETTKAEGTSAVLLPKKTLSDEVGVNTPAHNLRPAVWQGRSGALGSGAARHLLILASRPVDDVVAENLRRADWSLHFAGSAAEASSLIERHNILVGLRIVWPDDSGKRTDELRGILARYRQIRWVGAFSPDHMEQESIISLVAEYLYDFLSLPLDSEGLDVILGHAYRMALMANRHIQSQGREHVGRFGIVGASPTMRDLFHAIERAAKCDLPVLISGDTGTGKETTASAIHASSAHSSGRFVALSCAAIPASRLQTELDAFARHRPRGMERDLRSYPDRSHGGTLFLDEIADLPDEAQATLLRFLESEGVAPLGTIQRKRPHVRLICASSKDLENMAGTDKFRLDLFYRLNALSIELPALRDRQSDIRVLAHHFLDEFRRHDSSFATGFSDDALVAIEQYEWPGNVRELRNRIHQAALCSRSAFITPGDLRLEHHPENQSVPSLQEAREAAEKQTIWSALRRNRHNLSRAARELRISRMTLYRLLSKHHMDRGG